MKLQAKPSQFNGSGPAAGLWASSRPVGQASLKEPKEKEMEKVKKTKEEGSKVQWGRGRTAEQRQYSTCIYFRLSVFFLKCA